MFIISILTTGKNNGDGIGYTSSIVFRLRFEYNDKLWHLKKKTMPGKVQSDIIIVTDYKIANTIFTGILTICNFQVFKIVHFRC